MKTTIALLLSCLSVVAAAFDFAINGKATCQLVTSTNPSRLEQMAADDLKEFLEKMTGAAFSLVTEKEATPDEGTSVYIGQTAFAGTHAVDFTSFGDEEWILKTVDKHLIISGGRPAGTFYGVWNLLNRLECYALSMDQYAIPFKPTLSIEELDIRQAPSFAGRLIYNDFPGVAMFAEMDEANQQAYKLFSLRNGTNGSQTHRIKYHYMGKLFNISHNPFHHTLTLYVQPDKYFDSHPEYFGMDQNGVRIKPQGAAKGSLCMSNKDVWTITLNSLRDMIQADRARLPQEEWPSLYDISLLDNSPYICKCPECTAITTEEESEAGLLLRYINYVATEIAKEYPEIIIRTFAYSAARKPPKITRPAGNILLQYCDEFPTGDAYRPLTAPINQQNLDSLNGWLKLGAKLQLYDYWIISGNYFDPPRMEVVLNALQPDMQLFHDKGVLGMFVEFERDFASPQIFYDLQFFIATQLMMDVNVDVAKLTDIFLDNFYGPAAPVMKRWLNEVCEGMRTQPVKMTILNHGSWNYLTPSYLLSVHQRLKAAAEPLPEGSIYRRRVEDELLTANWVALSKRVNVEPCFKAAGIDMEELIQDCRKYSFAHLRRFNPRKPENIEKRFTDKFDKYTLSFPRPDKFKDVPDEDFRLVTYTFGTTFAHLDSSIIDDPESITGKTLQSHGPDKNHGVGTMIQATDTIRVPALKFDLGNIGAKRDIHEGTKWEISKVLTEVPQDEKYHWFKLDGAIDLQEQSYFWCHCWAIQFKTDSFYLLTDGVADNNVWECWVSAKFTGPAYVPGSTKQNSICVDMLALVHPGAPGVAP